MKQDSEIKKIIKHIIDASKKYEEKPTDLNITRIIDLYNETNLNITKSQYNEINNYLDEQISTFLHNRIERQQVQEYIIVVTDLIVSKIREICSDSTSTKNFIDFIKYISNYVKNHITIYSSMLTGIEETTKTQEKYKKQIDDTQGLLNEAKKELAKEKDTVDNLLPNMLTVLGIFLSIVIAVVIIYIEMFLSNDEATTISSLINFNIQLYLSRYIISGHILGNVLFLLLFMIARLTNRSILMTCSHFEWKPEIPDDNKNGYATEFHRFACADCSADCSFAKKLKRKSAYILYFNGLMIALYVMLYIWWVIDHYIAGKGSLWLSTDFWIISIVALCTAIWLACKAIKKKNISNNKKSTIDNLREASNNNIDFKYCSDKPISYYGNNYIVFTNNLKLKCQSSNSAYCDFKEELSKIKNRTRYRYTWKKEKDNYILYYKELNNNN